MVEHFNKLTPAEDERLALLIEECAEVIQAAAKIQRHGYGSVNPMVISDVKETNRAFLEKEIGHVQHALFRLVKAGDVKADNIVREEVRKLKNIEQWLHHQEQGQ